MAKKYEGQWLDDKRHGAGKFYDADGTVIETGKWNWGVFNSNADDSEL